LPGEKTPLSIHDKGVFCVFYAKFS
jgi:hypothetical protein